MVDDKVDSDEDGIWEIANSIRWLNHTFKDKFKIEKFIFGEIYSMYYATAPDFIIGLMEELGYDKDEKLNESSEKNEEKDVKSPDSLSAYNSSHLSTNVAKSPTLPNNSIIEPSTNEQVSKNSFVLESARISQNSLNISSQQITFARVNNLFEEFETKFESEETEQDYSISQNLICLTENSGNDLLDDFKKKRT